MRSSSFVIKVVLSILKIITLEVTEINLATVWDMFNVIIMILKIFPGLNKRFLKFQ